MKSSIFRILTMIVLSAGLMFSRVGYVSADNPAGNYYHKILPNGHCVDNRFKTAAEAHQQGFNLPGKCPDVSPTSTNSNPTSTQSVPTATKSDPTATKISPTSTHVNPTNTAFPTATKIVVTATPAVTNTAIVDTATPTITPFPLRANLTTPNCPNNNNGFLPWLFLILGSIGTALGIGNARTVRKLKNIH